MLSISPTIFTGFLKLDHTLVLAALSRIDIELEVSSGVARSI